MASGDKKALIDAIDRAANSLRRASRWSGSGRMVSIRDARNYVFEFYCYFRIVRALSQAYEMEYVPGFGDTANCFPRNPAGKRGRPKYIVRSRNGARAVLWQLCAGTQVRDVHNGRRAPDVSLQTATASDDPLPTDVAIIWDAKYRGNHDSAISDADFSRFARLIILLGLGSRPMPRLRLGPLDQLAAHALLTNGEFSNEPDAELARAGFKEARRFFPGKNFDTRP